AGSTFDTRTPAKVTPRSLLVGRGLPPPVSPSLLVGRGLPPPVSPSLLVGRGLPPPVSLPASMVRLDGTTYPRRRTRRDLHGDHGHLAAAAPSHATEDR